MHKLRAWARVLYRCAAGSICIGFAAVSSATSPRVFTGRPFLRVRVLRSQKKIEIDGFGPNINGVRLGPTLLPVHMRVRISREHGIWFVRAEPGSGLLNSVVGRPVASAIRSRAPTLTISGSMLKFNGQLQPPAAVVLEARSNRFDVVENLPIGEYLEGVLPNEMPIHWPMAALEAQAVASVSYAEAESLARASEGFDVDNTVESQVFNWQTYAHLTFAGQRKIARILFETRGRLLIGHNGKPYLAYFHSDCGGATELPQNVWGNGAPQGVVVHDSYCLLDRHNRWHARLSLTELQNIFRANLHGFNGGLRGRRGELRNIKIASYSPSGRAEQLTLATDDGSLKINAQDFRRKVGYARLKSTLFSITRVVGGFEFSGRGFGHGVGLCQHGARFMAMNGSNYTQILMHYYPLARLIDIEPIQLRAPLSATVVAQSN